MQGSLSLVSNIHGELCAISKAGGVGMDLKKLIHFSRIASVKVNELTAILKEAVHAVSNSF